MASRYPRPRHLHCRPSAPLPISSFCFFSNACPKSQMTVWPTMVRSQVEASPLASQSHFTREICGQASATPNNGTQATAPAIAFASRTQYWTGAIRKGCSAPGWPGSREQGKGSLAAAAAVIYLLLATGHFGSRCGRRLSSQSERSNRTPRSRVPTRKVQAWSVRPRR